MAQQVQFPTDTLQELLEVHTACEKEAIAVFMEHSFKDDNHEFQKKLIETTERKKEALLLRNEEASVKYCQAQLEQLSEALMQSISRGAFSVPGGHRLYLEAKKKVEFDYKLVPRKGVKVRNKEIAMANRVWSQGRCCYVSNSMLTALFVKQSREWQYIDIYNILYALFIRHS
nr:guanylate-binding protein 4-like [Marmota flaviventris]